ncbi:MAG: uncharacterized protein H6Q89_3642 [Myxococcaceae bacterium]|nr:uncharacterized protein [Myxococcaceae bacterium]
MRIRTLSGAWLVLIGLTGCPGGSPLTDAGTMPDGGQLDAGTSRVTGSGQALVSQGGGVVVVGSVSRTSTDSEFLLVRYHGDGGVDSSFGTNGTTTTQFDPYIDPVVADAGFPTEQKTDTAYAVVLQGDKLLVGGTAASQGDLYGAYAVTRYSAAGVLDPSFGVAGRALVRVRMGGPVHALALRSDGKIYAAGFVSTGNPGTNGANLAIVRFSSEGSVDSTFGGAQGVVGDFGKNEDVRGLVFQNLKVLAGGGDDFLVARYNDDGSLDPSFGVAGVAKSPGGFANNFRALPSGGLLLSGSRRTTSDGPWVLKLVRYTFDGQLDTTFGTAGVLEAPLDNRQVSTLGLELLPDGRILTVNVGGFGSGSGPIATAARYSAAGVVDTGFGTSGVLALDASLPLLLGQYPPSPNNVALAGDRLLFTHTDVYAGMNAKVIFRSYPLP